MSLSERKTNDNDKILKTMIESLKALGNRTFIINGAAMNNATAIEIDTVRLIALYIENFSGLRDRKG